MIKYGMIVRLFRCIIIGRPVVLIRPGLLVIQHLIFAKVRDFITKE